jgi:outer membrane protein OmpA-like peptidoglycan-associated protein
VPITPLRFVQICLAWLLSSGLLISPVVSAQQLAAEIYMADVHQSTWNFSGSPVVCELIHEIPLFGQARFQRLAGEALSFHLDSHQPVPEPIEGVLREASPPWNHNNSDKMEQIIKVETGLQPITLDRRPAGWLLSTLAKGQIGSFDMLDWNDSRKMLRIRLSPVNFQQPYRAFKQCQRELSREGFQDVQSSTVHFALDADQLDEDGKARLKRLAAYIKADSSVTAVRIAGHADDQGSLSYNRRLSARRAKRVCDYLEQQGVARELLSRHHYGESRPKIRGRSQRARAANRRAEIELAH